MRTPRAPKIQPVEPRSKTVLLDQFNVGETYGYTQSEGNRMCSGEAVSHDKDEQSSWAYKYHNNYDM